VAWCNDVSSIVGANGSVVGTGSANTVAIDAACTSGAGQDAADYVNGSKTDWYLPSLSELTEMFALRETIGGFTTTSYWSSSEENGGFAKRLGFPDGGMSGHVKSQGFRVRPIRAFAPLTDCQLGLSCAVGDIGPAGGRIIYVNPNESNEYDYVEAAPSDIAPTVWCSGSKATTLIGGTDSWRRQADAAQSHSVIQRHNCTTGGGLDAHNYSANGLTGWGVPNIGLVQLMRTSLYANNIGDFTAAQYMTSNEQDQNTAITVDMADGALAVPAKTVATRLRPVRFFAKTDRRKFTPTLSGISVPSNSMSYGDADFNVSTSSTGINEMGGSFTSFGAITYTSSNTSVATIEANTGRVSIVGSGSFTITATQTAWGVFKAPVAVTNTISVSNGTPTLTGLSLPSYSYFTDQPDVQVTAPTSVSQGTITYTSSNPLVATIGSSSGIIDIVGHGVVRIRATQAAAGYWNAASQDVTITVTKFCRDGGPCAVGDVGPGGGIVFMVAGSVGNGTGKYFEAAKIDWNGSGSDPSATACANTGASGTQLATGVTNTAIHTAQTLCSGAANLAVAYRGGTKSDWFLPSADELSAMYSKRSVIGGFSLGEYWSSSTNANGANSSLDFANGTSGWIADPSAVRLVRPIRQFSLMDGLTELTAGTSASQLKSMNGYTGSGNYWLKPSSYPGPARRVWIEFDRSGESYVLIGKGRQSNEINGGWFGTDLELAVGGLLQENASAAGISKLSGEFVNYLMNNTADGWDNSDVQNFMVANRIDTATDGYGGAGDSFKIKVTSSTRFTWVDQFGSANGGPNGSGEITRYLTQWMTGTQMGPYARGLSDNYFDCNCTSRLFTWQWGGHGSYHGWSSGQSEWRGFVNAGEGHAIQFVQLWMRS
jgi:hypothetical protein